MASIRDWPGDVTALAVGHVIGTVIVARAARASGRVCPASHSIIVTMGFASPATVLLWVLALRPSAGSDAITLEHYVNVCVCFSVATQCASPRGGPCQAVERTGLCATASDTPASVNGSRH